ncbi:hypothetical protein BDN67DRAFT_985920 [Paxillus ammoniavirescens]|nr:hypothetical protein BDN67DRAFT_985920 [Paxillus ammoniavirescens]
MEMEGLWFLRGSAVISLAALPQSYSCMCVPAWDDAPYQKSPPCRPFIAHRQQIGDLVTWFNECRKRWGDGDGDELEEGKWRKRYEDSEAMDPSEALKGRTHSFDRQTGAPKHVNSNTPPCVQSRKKYNSSTTCHSWGVWLASMMELNEPKEGSSRC